MFGSRHDDTTPTTGPSRGFVAAAALLALVAVGLVVVLVYSFTRPDDPAPTTAAPNSTSTAAAVPSSSTPTTSDPGGEQGRPPGCATTGTDQTVPTSTPAGVTWTLAKKAAVPSSATDGPALRDPASGVGYCYARTPLGALLAVSNYGQGTGETSAITAALRSRLTVQNEYTEPFFAQPSSPSSGGSQGQMAGYRIISYSPDQAAVSLAIGTSPSGPYGVGTVSVQWDHGDWRVVPQAGPAVFVTPSTTSSLTGFVPWSGVAP